MIATPAEIRAQAREIVQTHRRLYALQSELEQLTGFAMRMDWYEGLLMAGDDEPISDEEMDEALGMAVSEGPPDTPAEVAFRAMFPDTGGSMRALVTFVVTVPEASARQVTPEQAMEWIRFNVAASDELAPNPLASFAVVPEAGSLRVTVFP